MTKEILNKSKIINSVFLLKGAVDIMSYTTEYIGKRIKQRRHELHLTQEQLSERVDIAANYLGQIENGKRGVNLTNIVKIANELGVTIDYLMSDINSAAIEKSNDLEERWLELFNNRSPHEKELLINIVKDLSLHLFN